MSEINYTKVLVVMLTINMLVGTILEWDAANTGTHFSSVTVQASQLKNDMNVAQNNSDAMMSDEQVYGGALNPQYQQETSPGSIIQWGSAILTFFKRALGVFPIPMSSGASTIEQVWAVVLWWWRYISVFMIILSIYKIFKR